MMNWLPYKKRENFSDYFIEVRINPQPKHPDKLEICIVLYNKSKKETVLRADNSHIPLPPKGGKWPFHIHFPNSNGRGMYVGNESWEYNKLFVDYIKKDNRLNEGEKIQIQNKLEMIWPEEEIKLFCKEP